MSGMAKIVRSLLHYLPATILPAIASPIVTAIFTRTFRPSEYGLYVLVMAVAIPIADGSAQWVAQPAMRFLAEYELEGKREEYREAVATMIAAPVGVIAGLGILLLGVLWIGRVTPSHFGLLVAALLLIVLRGPNLALLQILRAALKPTSYLLAVVISTGLAPILCLALVELVSHDISWLIWGQVLALAAAMPLLVAWSGMSLGSLHWKSSDRARAVILRFSRYGTPMTLWWLGSTFLATQDRFIIAAFRNKADVAIYTVNYGLIAGAAVLLTSPIDLGFGPVVYRQWSEGFRESTRVTISLVTELHVYIALFFLGTMVVAGLPVEAILIGPHFRTGLAVLIPLAIGSMLWTIAFVGHKCLELGEGTQSMVISVVVATVLNVTLNLLLVPELGITAAAWVTAVSYAAYTAFIWWQARSVVPWSIDLARTARACAAVGVATAAGLVCSMATRGIGNGAWVTNAAAFCVAFALATLIMEGRLVRALLHKHNEIGLGRS